MKFEAILFDCDGVLVDSEAITNGILRDMLAESGWALTPEECMRIFIGRTVRSEAARIEAHTGRPLTDEWLAEFYARRNAELDRRLEPVEHALDVVERVHAHFGGRIACASGADRHKVELQLAKVGLSLYFGGGRIFSGHEVPRTKPAPDVYLAAAAALQVPPERCAVVEDTTIGVAAGAAAGATVLAYAPVADPAADEALRAAGAVQVFRSMAELPALLGC